VTQADFRNGPRHFLGIGQRRQFLRFARHLQVHRAHQAQQRPDEGSWPSPGARYRRSGSALLRAGLHHDRTRYAYYKKDPSLESKKDYPSFSKGTGGLNSGVWPSLALTSERRQRHQQLIGNCRTPP
jgi:hypothetical protein